MSTTSGNKVDTSEAFAWIMGENGAPLIDDMEKRRGQNNAGDDGSVPGRAGGLKTCTFDFSDGGTCDILAGEKWSGGMPDRQKERNTDI